ncbi:LPXTG-motif cell wall anchor domain-containing protein/conserved repeat domain-containing protein/fimbrial isopeptide formation D2 domain-containing protein [Actinomyces ruminicola]|uniref:LPXTG-motif cell wall anchor domain-containing protein/conserved repeat domain-containing protein/fimbrial isopeptide formation D2 domain-containing protein n=1 Tax=Actinomyces ruminicola TaxID=332524 RepID=A0A1H0B3Q9_9ACTO|nr:SpaH/EbpB family LPXTG-anchored major pilin [Actinomyces ruminicola]SDN40334.1 LPXTG-motif cell wall anchor domain-containing protein/conserved repeat domain-containing protein/fimbrial isopeptide formation D2 domain-containing protein [Actinomyces ruminicola]
MTSLTRRRCAGLAAAVALAIGGAVAAPVATAAPVPAILAAVEATDADVALIDATAKPDLTIHKLAQTETNGTSAGNGLEDTSATGDPVSGVTFTITKLDFDLTTQAGWQALADLDGDVSAARSHTTDTTYTATTGADGLAKFTDVELGAYIVSETATPANVTPAEDFIVTLPMTNASTQAAWNYDVHVYPKNAVVDATKEVSDSTAPSVGDTLTYTIKADVPKLDVAGGATIKNYQIVDPLDSRLDYSDAAVSMIGTGAVTLTQGDDYSIVSAEGADGKTYVTVTFTAAGRAKIAAARADGDATTQVQVVINAVVREIGSGQGAISNQASLIPNDSQTTWDPENPTPDVPGEPTEEVKSYYGKVTITKTGTDGKDASTYAGAEFQVYQCSPTGASQGQTIDRDAANITGDALTANAVTNGVTTEDTAKFTTGEDGTVTIDALQTNDFINNAVVASPGWYCLVETKAPEGYELQSDPIAFQVLRANVADSPYTIGFTVTDVPSNAGFRLPLTGANGILFLTVAGVLLVGGAVLLAVHNKRRNAED